MKNSTFARILLLLLSSLVFATEAAVTVGQFGWIFETVVTGTSLSTPQGLAWDNKGFLYIADGSTSSVVKVPVSALPITDESSFIWKKTYSNDVDHANGLIFKDGRLYLSQTALSQIAEIDPSNGNILRTISTAGVVKGPYDMQIDPLSGDVFVSDIEVRGALTGGICRIKNIGSAPQIIPFASILGGAAAFFFSPVGTLYISGARNEYSWIVPGTNQPNHQASPFPGSVDFVAGGAYITCSGNDDRVILTGAGSGEVYALAVNLGQAPQVLIEFPNRSNMDLARVGPDGKLYVTKQLDNEIQVFRMHNPTSGCTIAADPSNSPANFPSLCDRDDGNCFISTVNNRCATTHASTSGPCVTLEFSPSVFACPP